MADGELRGVTLPVAPADVAAAAAAIAGHVALTPTSASTTLSSTAGCEVFLKFENLQFTSSFKERGALTFLLSLDDDQRARGVVAASAGNHAQGLAYHASRLGIPTVVVMPRDTPFTKVTRTEVHGAEIVLDGEGFDESVAVARQIAEARGASFVPAFDHPLVIAGQGTVALEMLDAVPDLDALVVPVGGGGLVAGMAVAAKARRPDVRIVGVQVEGYEGMLHALGRAGPPEGGPTIADGIAVVEPGLLTRAVVAALIDDLLVVSEQAVESAVADLLEIEKVVVEGAGAAGLAAVFEHGERFAGQRVGIVVSGGNIDLRVLASVILRALARSGRLHRLRIEVTDRPGVLATIASTIAAAGGNILEVEHRRDLPGVAVRSLELDVSIEVRDASVAERIVAALERGGFRVRGAG